MTKTDSYSQALYRGHMACLPPSTGTDAPVNKNKQINIKVNTMYYEEPKGTFTFNSKTKICSIVFKGTIHFKTFNTMSRSYWQKLKNK